MLTHVEARPSRTNPAKPRTSAAPARKAAKSTPATGEDVRAEKWRRFLDAVAETEKMVLPAAELRRDDEDDDRYLARLLDGMGKLRRAWYDPKGKDIIGALVEDRDRVQADKIIDERLSTLMFTLNTAIISLPTRSLEHLEEKWRCKIADYPTDDGEEGILFREAMAMGRAQPQRSREQTLIEAAEILQADIREALSGYGKAFELPIPGADQKWTGVIENVADGKFEPEGNLPFCAFPRAEEAQALFAEICDIFVARAGAEAILAHPELGSMCDWGSEGTRDHYLFMHDLREALDKLLCTTDRLQEALSAMLTDIVCGTGPKPDLQEQLARRWSCGEAQP